MIKDEIILKKNEKKKMKNLSSNTFMVSEDPIFKYFEAPF
jgi:hypothetical protein